MFQTITNNLDCWFMKRFFSLAAAFCAVILLSTSCANRIPDTKKGIMDAFVAGTLDPSYAPAAFFIHFAPAQIVNTPTDLNGVPFTLQDGIDLFGRPVLGGFDRKGVFNTLSDEEVAAETHAILKANPAGRVMIGADCTVGSAPLANIQAAVVAAHGER